MLLFWCFSGSTYSFYLKSSVWNCVQSAKLVFYLGRFSRGCIGLRCTWKGNSSVDFKWNRIYNHIQCEAPEAIHLHNLAVLDILNAQQSLREPCSVALDDILLLLTFHNFSEKLGTSSVFKIYSNTTYALLGRWISW